MIKKFDTNAVDDLIRDSLGSDENLEMYLNDIPEDEAVIAQLMKEVLWMIRIVNKILKPFNRKLVLFHHKWLQRPTTYCAMIPTSNTTLEYGHKNQ